MAAKSCFSTNVFCGGKTGNLSHLRDEDGLQRDGEFCSAADGIRMGSF